jgi:glucan phosphoethanolaminetransferase (alkaline phosphatase superfamily)
MSATPYVRSADTQPSRVVRVPARAWVLASPALLTIADLWLRLRANGSANPHRWTTQDAAVYALGVVWSFASWSLGAELLSRWPRAPKARAAFFAIVAPIVSFLFMASFAYRQHFDQSASWQVVKWSIAEIRSVWMIARWIVGPLHVLAMIVIGFLLVAPLWRPLAPLRWPAKRLPRVAYAFSGAAYLALSALVLGAPGFQDPLPVDSNAAAAFVQYGIASVTKVRHLVTPVRPALPPQPAKKRPNVLLLVHESLRADAVLPGLGYLGRLDTASIAPFGSTIPTRGDAGYYVFPKARTNSTATESSVPTILSGVDPGGASDAYGRATSLWHLGKATGARTFLFSAQSYSFSHFDEYFLDANVDVDATGTELSPDMVNDRGIDDTIAVDAAIEHMTKLAAEKAPFVGAIHFNATHSPGYPGPGLPMKHKDRADPEQYAAAARFIDQQQRRIMEALDRLGLADSTIVIASSDHGENIGPYHGLDRLGSYFEECVRIPIWVRVPPALLKEHPEWGAALAAWRDRNVQNLDVLPTVVDVLGLEASATQPLPELPGRSLVRAPNGDNEVRGQSTCGYRQWALEGWYLVHDDVKVIVSSIAKDVQIYDLTKDPDEAHDLAGDPAWRERVRPWIERALREGEERRAVCKRQRKSCPVDPDSLR